MITEPLIFFEFHPGENLISYGRINPDGTQEMLGTADYDSRKSVPIVEIPEEIFSVEERFLFPQLPVDVTALFASRIPEVELSRAEKEALEREWAEHNYYSYSEIAELNWDFIYRALYEVYSVAQWGLPQSSDPEENIRFKKEYEYYLSRFSDEVKSSAGWADFLAMKPIRDPIFSVLQAQSTKERISATIIGNRFSGFYMLPFLMEIEMEKEGDDWLFTRIDNVKVYEAMQEMLKADPEMYYLLVKIYNYRKGKGMQL